MADDSITVDVSPLQDVQAQNFATSANGSGKSSPVSSLVLIDYFCKILINNRWKVRCKGNDR